MVRRECGADENESSAPPQSSRVVKDSSRKPRRDAEARHGLIRACLRDSRAPHEDWLEPLSVPGMPLSFTQEHRPGELPSLRRVEAPRAPRRSRHFLREETAPSYRMSPFRRSVTGSWKPKPLAFGQETRRGSRTPLPANQETQSPERKPASPDPLTASRTTTSLSSFSASPSSTRTACPTNPETKEVFPKTQSTMPATRSRLRKDRSQ